MPISEDLPFSRGATYRRREDIHGRFGGQQQGGISTPLGAPFVFLFTGNEGEAYGYQDGWDAGGIFRYTGEGQIGDMEFRAGNKAIRDHATDGKDLLLFQTLGKGKPVRFLGTFSLANFELVPAPDKKGAQRQAIVFHLIPADDVAVTEGADIAATVPSTTSLGFLRAKAYAAAAANTGAGGRVAQRIYRERSIAVRDYVLARANGACECCGENAPFVRTDGSPYLEPHHIRRLSDGGPDHPAHVGAVCPNCHREIHVGRDGDARNQALQVRVTNAESAQDHD